MNKKDLVNYERDGYIILKNIIKKNDCKNLINNTLKKILLKHNICLKNKYWKKDGDLISGKYDDHPISKKSKNYRWPKLFNSKKLINTINKLHGGENKWKWVDGASKGLGWIHLRYPFKKKWIIPKNGWHLDGTIHGKINPYQSIILLPFITKVDSGCGGTAILKGSHKLINYWIHNLQNKISLFDYIYDNIKKNNNNIIEATGNQGDILLMHPHLIHSSSDNLENNDVRITFNLSTNHVSS